MQDKTDINSIINKAHRVYVWDIPVRLFHWILLALIIALVVTGEILDDGIELHAQVGLATLVLILFRLFWGVLGSSYARFSQFVRGPSDILAYARSLLAGQDKFVAGHNPLGGWMVVLLLVAILSQSVLGMFANDDILFEGPFTYLISKETSDLLTGLHEDLFHILLILVGMHIAAVIWHKLFRGENLLGAMITGYKKLPPGVQVQDAHGGGWLLAMILFGASAGTVCWLAW